MVHAHDRDVERIADGVRDRGAHQKCARQPRTFGDGNGVDVGLSNLRLSSTWSARTRTRRMWVAARKLGYDAAVGAVHIDLRVNGVGKQPFFTVDQGRRTFRRTNFQCRETFMVQKSEDDAVGVEDATVFGSREITKERILTVPNCALHWLRGVQRAKKLARAVELADEIPYNAPSAGPLA